MKDYWASGEFSRRYNYTYTIENRARLNEAVVSNVRQYAIIAVIFIIAALFIIFGNNMYLFVVFP